MPSQRQIERFTLEFHRVAVGRMRTHPEYLAKAVDVLNRWEAQGESPRSQVYRDSWRQLLHKGVDAIEHASGVDTDNAATLRSTSPLGFVLTESERLQIRSETMA